MSVYKFDPNKRESLILENTIIGYAGIQIVLHYYVDRFDSQARAAKSLGISEQYLSDLINGKREISSNVARKLGYKRIVRYKKEEL